MSRNNNQFDCELISAYLDDALSGSERHQAEQMLASDDQAARYLEQLRATRECLRSVASHGLTSSFAARVISQARDVAERQGLAADHHVLREAARENDCYSVQDHSVIPSSLDSSRQSAKRTDWTATDWIPRNNRILWSALFTTAAALICMFTLPNFFFDGPAKLDGTVSQISPDSMISPGTSP